MTIAKYNDEMEQFTITIIFIYVRPTINRLAVLNVASNTSFESGKITSYTTF
jgi:hypothetical protein